MDELIYEAQILSEVAEKLATNFTGITVNSFVKTPIDSLFGDLTLSTDDRFLLVEAKRSYKKFENYEGKEERKSAFENRINNSEELVAISGALHFGCWHSDEDIRFGKYIDCATQLKKNSYPNVLNVAGMLIPRNDVCYFYHSITKEYCPPPDRPDLKELYIEEYVLQRRSLYYPTDLYMYGIGATKQGLVNYLDALSEGAYSDGMVGLFRAGGRTEEFRLEYYMTNYSNLFAHIAEARHRARVRDSKKSHPADESSPSP